MAKVKDERSEVLTISHRSDSVSGGINDGGGAAVVLCCNIVESRPIISLI